MAKKKIGVGIIGAGGWTQYGHIPALKALENEFDLIGISTRKKSDAESVAAKFKIPNAYDNPADLLRHPGIDLVSVTVPAPFHAEMVKKVIAVGKDVYSEWPLTTTTAASQELLELAKEKYVRHIVGLQRKFGPSARYVRDLIGSGYVGELRSARMLVSADAFYPELPIQHAWITEKGSFTDILSVYGAHFSDVLFQAVGWPKSFFSLVRNQFPEWTLIGSDKKVSREIPDQVFLMGALDKGAPFSIQLEGAQLRRTGVQIDITGTEGVLKISNSLAFQNKEDNLIEGMRGAERSFSELSVPERYKAPELASLDVSVQDLAYLYQAYAYDRRNGASTASSFEDALKHHHFIDEILSKSPNITAGR